MKPLLFPLAALVCCILFAGCAPTANHASSEVAMTGKVCCAKCYLHQTQECQAALIVTENGQDTVYYVTMDDKGNALLHDEACKQPKNNVTVKGVVTEQNGQKWITASSIQE